MYSKIGICFDIYKPKYIKFIFGGEVSNKKKKIIEGIFFISYIKILKKVFYFEYYQFSNNKFRTGVLKKKKLKLDDFSLSNNYVE